MAERVPPRELDLQYAFAIAVGVARRRPRYGGDRSAPRRDPKRPRAAASGGGSRTGGDERPVRSTSGVGSVGDRYGALRRVWVTTDQQVRRTRGIRPPERPRVRRTGPRTSSGKQTLAAVAVEVLRILRAIPVAHSVRAATRRARILPWRIHAAYWRSRRYARDRIRTMVGRSGSLPSVASRAATSLIRILCAHSPLTGRSWRVRGTGFEPADPYGTAS